MMEDYLSLDEAAKRLKAHPNIVQELVYSGYIRTVQTSEGQFLHARGIERLATALNVISLSLSAPDGTIGDANALVNGMHPIAHQDLLMGLAHDGKITKQLDRYFGHFTKTYPSPNISLPQETTD